MDCRRTTRRIVTACALLAAAGALAAPGPALAGLTVDERPSIVLVLTDDQRWDTLPFMPTVASELAGRGVTFANAFVVNPLCCPSRATILTGRYSHSTGVYTNVLPHGGAGSFDDGSTIATWLRAGGYRTAYVGKYLNGYRAMSARPGWDRWVGYDGGYFNYVLNVDGIPTRYGNWPASYSTDVLAREAVSFVEETRGPFFLVFAPSAPHGPALPAPRHAGAFAELPPWRPPSYDEAEVGDKPGWLRGRPSLTDADRAALDAFRKRQLASLLAVDEAVKAILEALSASGRLAHTLVAFTSDNGLTWGEHRLANRKIAAFEESIRVPLVIRYDVLARERRTDRRLVANIDLAPTFAELGGVPAPGVEGKSLLPLLGATGRPWRNSFLIEHLAAERGVAAEVPTYCAVRGERFKYVAYGSREEELYDLAADPSELANRAAEPAFRRELLAMRARLKAACDPPPPGFYTDWICTIEAEGSEGVLVGTRRADTICGSDASEVIHGRGRADIVRAAAGDDGAYGDAGNDRLAGGPGRDRLSGGAGNDTVRARDREVDVVRCGPGRDAVSADRRDRVARDCELVRRS